MIYLDTSAVAKLVVEEAESSALAQWVDDRPDDVLCTSALTRVELLRAASRRSPDTVPAALAILAQLAIVPLDDLVLEGAATASPTTLRSLDAIHLASATSLLPDRVTVVSYDQRLLDAARGLGLEAVMPGAHD